MSYFVETINQERLNQPINFACIFHPGIKFCPLIEDRYYIVMLSTRKIDKALGLNLPRGKETYSEMKWPI